MHPVQLSLPPSLALSLVMRHGTATSTRKADCTQSGGMTYKDWRTQSVLSRIMSDALIQVICSYICFDFRKFFFSFYTDIFIRMPVSAI